MRLRTVIADRLALALLAAQKVDQRLSEDETEDQRGGKGTASPEGDVAKQVEKVPAVGKLGKPVKHLCSSFFRQRALPDFAQGVNDQTDFRAFRALDQQDIPRVD